jgi:beta-lactam-binding protein with PASTA domain
LHDRDETEITQNFGPAEPPPPPPPEPPPPGPPPGPPRGLIDDVWPWLALLALLAVAGLLVWLFVLRDTNSKGNTVPAVVGLQQQQAIKRLQDDGYSVKVILEPANKPRGIVVSQAPGSGARLGKGGVVTLHVSNGRPLVVTTSTTETATTTAATTTTAAPQAAVPDVVGQDMVSAAGQVEAAGFVAETQPVESSEAEGSVTAENPAGGTQAPAGSTVVLQVAVGPNRPAQPVPNVLGQKASAARAKLLEAGFTVKTEDKKAAKKFAGVVIAQRPAGGTQPKYTQVVITVGST